MSNSRVFWKIYLDFVSFLVLTGAVVGIFALNKQLAGVAAVGIGTAVLLFFGFFLASRIARPLIESISRIAAAEAELKKSEQYQNLFRLAGDAILIFEPEDEIILNVNEKACEIYKLKREDFIGRSLKTMSQNVSRGSEELEKLLHDGVYDEFESVHIRGDGTPINLVINAAVIEYENRPAIMTVNRDVTARKQIEETLRESEERFRSVASSAQDAIVSADSRGKIIFWNEAAQKVFGYGEREVLGESLQMIMPAAHRQAHQTGLERHARTGENHLVGKTAEVPGRRKDGSEFPLELSLGAWETSKGRFYTAVIRDVTERNRVRQSLEESEEKFRSIIETAKDSIWAFDLDCKLTYNNPAIEAILGYTPEELRGQSFLPLMHEKDRAEFERMFPQFVGEKRGWANLVCRWLHKDGGVRYLESSGVPILDGGELRGFRGTNHHITERREAEDALRRSEANLAAAQRIARLGSWEVELSNLKRINNHKVRWSEEVSRLFGYEPGQLDVSVNDYFDLIHADDRKAVRRAFLEAVSRRQKLNVEYRAVLPDGTERFQHGQGEVICDRQTNEPLKFVGTVQDITERRRAEEKLRDGEAWLRAILDGSRDGIVIEDAGRIVYTNDAYARVLRFDAAEDLIGTEISELLPPDETERLAEYGRMRLRGEDAPSVYEFTGKCKDGTAVEVEGSVSTTVIGGKKYIVTAVRDIGERTRTREELQKNVSLLSSTFEATADGILAVGADNKIVAFNEKFARMWGMTAAELEAMDSADAPAKIADQIVKSGDYHEKTKRIDLRADDSTLDVLELKDGRIFERYSQSQKLGAVVAGRVFSFRDVTRRQRAEEERDRFFKLSLDLLCTAGFDGYFKRINPAWTATLGFAEAELLARPFIDFIHPDDRASTAVEVEKLLRGGSTQSFEIRLLAKDGTVRWFDWSATPFATEQVFYAVGKDFTARKQAEERLLHDAFHDPLTGLANRKLFMEHLQTTIDRARRGGEYSYAILFLDFDGFKVVNDSLGHAAGDRLLKQIAGRLDASLRSGDVVARLGGDEFTILLSRLTDEKAALQIAERIQEDLKKPFDLSGREVFTSASIGIALGAPGASNQADGMLRDADIAMYRAKSNGKARYQVFDRLMHEQAIKRLRLETEMRQAVEREEFCALYQPIIDIETNRLMGFESLIRWRHPKRGMVPPFDFIPVAEENNLILPIGKWILRESCRQLRRWQSEIPAASDLTVSVNLSCKEFLQLDLAEQINETLRETGLNPECLKLEITESHVMENSGTAVAMMNRLRALGVRLSLDDFGTGYSSLSYLHRLPVNYLKIDRSFVMRMEQSAENEEIVRTIIRLAQNLKMQVIAEGIETAAQLAQLKQLECEYGQGYFFSKPLEAEAAKMLIAGSAENLTSVEGQPVINLNANM